MKRLASAVLAATALAGCSQHETPARAYRNWGDRLAVAVGLRDLGVIWPCTHRVQDKGFAFYEGTPVDQCVKFDPPRIWQGLWRNDFEGSQFCQAPARSCAFEMPGDRVWLDASIPFPEPIKKRRFGGLYAIEFVGRKTKYKGSYGHLGVSDQEIIVDRLISIREVEAPPKPTKSVLEMMKEDCRRTPKCSVEELVKEQTE